MDVIKAFGYINMALNLGLLFLNSLTVSLKKRHG